MTILRTKSCSTLVLWTHGLCQTQASKSSRSCVWFVKGTSHTYQGAIRVCKLQEPTCICCSSQALALTRRFCTCRAILHHLVPISSPTIFYPQNMPVINLEFYSQENEVPDTAWALPVQGVLTKATATSRKKKVQRLLCPCQGLWIRTRQVLCCPRAGTRWRTFRTQRNSKTGHTRGHRQEQIDGINLR